jgi:hypothetical protein
MVLSLFKEALRLGCVNPDGFCFKSSPSAPAAPDYVGAAQAQGAANKEAALVSGRIANPNVTNPYGSRTVTWGGTNDAPDVSINDTLSPTGQRLFDQQNQISLGLGDLANQSVSRVSNVMSTPFDASPYAIQKSIGYNGPQVTAEAGNAGGIQRSTPGLDLSNVQAIPQVNDYAMWQAQNQAYNQQRSRLDPQFNQQQTQTETQLVNQGLRPGTEAYDTAMGNFNRAKNDAYQTAYNNSAQQGLAAQQAQFGMGLQANQTGYNEALGTGQFGLQQGQFANQAQQQAYEQAMGRAQLQNSAAAQAFNQAQSEAQFANQAAGQGYSQALNTRELPLNETSALRSGAQVNIPQFGQYQGQNVQAAPIMQAAQNQGQWDLNNYNINQGANNSFNSGLFQVGAAAAMYF